MTHPFHPLSGQRLRVLFERKLPSGLAVSCEGGPLGSLMLPLAWTDRGWVAADGPLTYEVLVSLAAEISAVGHATRRVTWLTAGLPVWEFLV